MHDIEGIFWQFSTTTDFGRVKEMYSSRSDIVVVVSVVLPLLVIIATSLRFIAQRHNSILRTADDILVAFNCVSQTFFS